MKKLNNIDILILKSFLDLFIKHKDLFLTGYFVFIFRLNSIDIISGVEYKVYMDLLLKIKPKYIRNENFWFERGNYNIRKKYLKDILKEYQEGRK